MTSADTNLFVYAADPGAPLHAAARQFFAAATRDTEHEFVVCELVMIELYMQLRNAAVFDRPHSAAEATAYVEGVKTRTGWRHIDYDPAISGKLWHWAKSAEMSGFRQIIDARLALTLRHHGVTRFATANPKHFQGFGFSEVWNPLTAAR